MQKPSFTLLASGALLGAFATAFGCSSTETPSTDFTNVGSAGASSGAGAAQAGSSATAGSVGQITAGSGGTVEQTGTSGAGGSAPASAGGGQGGAAAGSSGAAGMPAGGAATGLCPASAQLCLDFEGGAYAGWTKKEEGGTVTLDGTHVSHGAMALLITAPSGKRGGSLENHGSPLFPLPQQQLWGRMMVYFDGVPDGHTDLAHGTGAKGGPAYNVGEQHASIMLNYYAGSSATDCWARPKPEQKVPDKTWMCWEWRFDSAKNQMDFWMDGALLRSVNANGDGCLTGNGVWQAPPSFESLSIGELVAETSKNAGSSVWIDDVAISNSARVGCPMP